MDEYHSKWYNDELNLAEKADIKQSDIKKPRNYSRQTYRSNQPVGTTKNYFKVVLAIPFLDHVLPDLQHRFSGNKFVPYRRLYLVPYLMFQEPENWKEEFMVFATFYLYSFRLLCNSEQKGANEKKHFMTFVYLTARYLDEGNKKETEVKIYIYIYRSYQILSCMD